jgi:hypothetical protein
MDIDQTGHWQSIRCPLTKGHKGLHADVNLYPFYTTADAEWSREQYWLCIEVGTNED